MAAAWVYFDASALVKRYITEPGTTVVQRLLRRREIVTSALTPVELASVFLRRRRAGELSQARFEALLRQLQSDRGHWTLVEASAPVLERAESLLQGFVPIGLWDAIQVASSVTFQAAVGIQVPLVTASVPQRDAALQRGVETIWVG